MMTELLLWCLVVTAYLAQARELRRVNRNLDELLRQNDLTVKLIQRQIDAQGMRR
jgi:hypothetical protein